ncbi:XRE family transcriptional regulator [Nocardiopsis gilva YIM 90087]|uniref:XRE family transcriptional regulator n=1 Tax=Nocardiopsis gilva YIM 90087 TaxID=1235441 RepID=A0A223S3N8_9ACTN|nr:helix-turn-helix transcriptional regulator [Nocardiopsis gilva]ASU82735.1 XRE family transcriptional regulator [Nocardiopsis gilva YIM 90087]
MPDSPTIKRRQLSNELRRLRNTAGMTVEQAAERLEWSRARLGHIETGRRKKPLITDIKALLDLYDVTNEREREAIFTLTRQARETGWWTRYDDVFTGRFPGFEAAASKIGTYEATLIPGLLQTPEYITAITKATLIYSEEDIQRVVDARLKRQEILSSPDQPELWAVIDEAALLRLGSGDLMASQVQHLIDVADDTSNSVTIQVLAIDAGLHAGVDGPFVLLDFDEDASPVVYLETNTDGIYLEEAGEIERYRKLFLHIQVAAMKPERSLAYLKNMLVKRKR